MTPLEPKPPWHLRVMAWAPFVASAALAALALQLGWEEPLLGLGLVALAAILVGPRLLQRRRMRKLLSSGDVDSVLDSFRDVLDRLPHRDTMEPLLMATALAAHGLTDRARSALARAKRGDAWGAALEHRLFVETLLDAFEGDRDIAVEKADALERLPLPPAGPLMKSRIVATRDAAGALARAFARRPRKGDIERLRDAARASPLLHWPMRYAAAVLCVDRGDGDAARRLIEDAPDWPTDSAFRDFHDELLKHAALDAI